VVFGFSGFYFNTTAAEATSAFLVAWTILFGYLLGRLYGKYTRVVQIASQDPDLLKVLVDNSDMTGKARTFATTSNHKLRAEVSGDASFLGWATSGGVTLEDPKSFETVMEVNGDGSITGRVSKKY
jgi:F420-0:gamma-glutamyl ligase-like protein